jgi:hypothetical protein
VSHQRHSPSTEADQLLWVTELDGRYIVDARLIPARRVVLLDRDSREADRTVLRRVLPLVGHPRYGADPTDVSTWQCLAVEDIDNLRPRPLVAIPSAAESADSPAALTSRRKPLGSRVDATATTVRPETYRPKRLGHRRSATVIRAVTPFPGGDAA